MIIIELLYRIVYRDNFDLSYRLSIGNSIWHIVTALLRKCSDLIREGKVFIKNKTKVASRVGCSERAVLVFYRVVV